jgi:RNA polymerase sigma-70 factor, ECF subfamily
MSPPLSIFSLRSRSNPARPIVYSVVQTVARTVAPALRGVVSTHPVATPGDHPAAPLKEPEWTRLVHRVAGGDHAALTALYDATSRIVFGLALRILADRDLAEDVVVEVYMQAWRGAAGYDPGRGTPSSWLLTLTRSRAIDLLRARTREHATDPLEAAGNIRSATPDPEEATADAERHREVRSALTSLSAEQREAIELAYFAGLSHTEIALRLGQPLGTVKTRIRLGMLRLRELLDHLTSPVLAVGREGTW